MLEVRPTKRARVRIACEPCRRKKAKCLGEKPTCAFCTRLGQSCYYANDATPTHTQSSEQLPSTSPQNANPTSNSSTTMEERVRMLEARLEEVVDKSRSSREESYRQPQIPQQFQSSSAYALSHAQNISGLQPLHACALPAWETIFKAAKQYLLYCDCQPLPLFDKYTFLQNLQNREPELLFAVLGLALRFCDDFKAENNAFAIAIDYSESARRLVMSRITTGPVELSTLQSLCLLSLTDFTNGFYHRANIHSSLAISLAHCAGLTSETSDTMSECNREERRRCFWSVFLLKRLHGVDMSVLDFFAEDNFPWYPKTTGRNLCTSEGNHSIVRSSGIGETKDLGIVAYGIQLSEVWFKTTRYARRRGTSSTLPPWSPQSEYAMVMAQTMDYETRMPYIHRYKQSGFASKSLEEIDGNRDYWAPWLFVQFLYHTNFCLLNHPLILALRLRSFKCSMPEVFLQHTADIISTHGNWIIHLIDTLRIKSFRITDPFLGHCVAIVATIFLQESHTGEVDARTGRKVMFEKCFDFVQDLAYDWPHMAQVSRELRRLQETISESRDTENGSNVMSHGLLIDLGRVWQILEYSTISDSSKSATGLFGRSLHVLARETTSGITTTSVLPPPTRLEVATAGTAPNADSSNVPSLQDVTTIPTSSTFHPNLGTGMQLFSDDELAVLAECFSDQREETFSQTADLWRPGNL